MTRLRVQLQKKNFTNEDLKKLVGVMGVNEEGPELQIVLGPGKAANVCSEFKVLLQGKESVFSAPHESLNEFGIGDGKALHAEIKEKNKTPFKLFLKRMANIFMPLSLPVLFRTVHTPSAG